MKDITIVDNGFVSSFNAQLLSHFRMLNQHSVFAVYRNEKLRPGECQHELVVFLVAVPRNVETFAFAVDNASALLHDENDDGKANRAFLGMMPKEGYGFSRDAKVRMGPPKFTDAVLEHTGEDQALTITMRYFL